MQLNSFILVNKTREAKIFRLLSKSIVSEDAGSVTNPHALESGQVEGTIIRLFLFGGNWLSYWLGSWLGCGLAWATVKSWGRSAIKSSWTLVSIASAIVVASIIVQILVVAIVVITLLVAIIVQVLVIT